MTRGRLSSGGRTTTSPAVSLLLLLLLLHSPPLRTSPPAVVATTAAGRGPAAPQRLEDGVLDLIASSLRRRLRSDRGAASDVNFMLGVSVAKGQLKSCTNHARMNNYNSDLDRIFIMIEKLYVKFYENQLQDLETTRKILDYRLWTSPQKIIRKSHIALSRDFNEDSIANGDLYFRNISDKCIRQVISTCEITPECFESELIDDFSGYALTHQVLHLHIFKKMNCANPTFLQMANKIIQHKCSMVFNEAQYIARNFNTLEKYEDLFMEQIAICGIQNMVDFIRPEWLSMMSTKIYLDCIQQENASCDSHFAGVSLASLGVYWKFLCYKANAYGSY